METPFIKKEPSELNLKNVTIKLEPVEGVDAKLYISNCQSCETPIEPRLSPIKKELVSPNNVKSEKESNSEELINPIVGIKLNNSPIPSEVKENKSSDSSSFLIPSNPYFKRSRSLSSSSSNFSYKPRKLNFHGPRPFAHHNRTNNNPYNHHCRRVNFSRRRPHWKKFKRPLSQSNLNYGHQNASPEINNTSTMEIELKPEMELRVVNKQLQISNKLVTNTSYYSENNDINTVHEKMSLNNSCSDKPEYSISEFKEFNSPQISSPNTLSQKPGYEENVPENISQVDNENSVEENDSQDILNVGNEKSLTVYVDGEETTFVVLDEVNDIVNEEEDDTDILIDNVNEREETLKLDVEIVQEIQCDNDITCVFSKLKEAHLCTKCFVEKRRRKKNLDGEVLIIKKIDNNRDIPLIDIEH